MNTKILNDLGTMTAVVVKNRAKSATCIGECVRPGSKARGLIIADNRILLATDYDFETEAAAEAHMKEVVAACVEWGAAGMPSLC